MRKGFLQVQLHAPGATLSQPPANCVASSSEQASKDLTQPTAADYVSQPAAHPNVPELQRPAAPSPEAAEAALQQCLDLLRSSADEKK